MKSLPKLKKKVCCGAFWDLRSDRSRPSRKAFAKKYPFIKTDFSEISGTDSAQRFLLELKGGRSDWDVAHMSTDFHSDYLPYMEKLDLRRMAENGVLQIRPEMIDPKGHNTFAASSIIDVAAFNKKLLPSALIPKSWDDFLKPEYKGRKFAVDIRPLGLAGLVPAMGQEWVVNFAGASGVKTLFG